ncbi:MAG: Crp/Fnr family transcriptional regulator [Oscillospiraceae bacterium]|jgi:CRP-like cAMP-binding protein
MIEQYTHVLKSNLLFQGISTRNLTSMLGCLDARIARYSKENAIFLAGSPPRWVGIVLRGAVQVVWDDIFGNRSILAKLLAGDLFGEAFACAESEILPVSVIAVTDCEVLLMDYKRIITTCSSSCTFHSHLIENMMRVLALKNLNLNQKIEILSARSIREKVMVYLSLQAAEQGSSRFRIPFNRQELADYLSVERSALSRELGAMEREGLISFSKNDFELHKP